MAWCLPGDKPLSEPMMVSLLALICVTKPQYHLTYIWYMYIHRCIYIYKCVWVCQSRSWTILTASDVCICQRRNWTWQVPFLFQWMATMTPGRPGVTAVRPAPGVLRSVYVPVSNPSMGATTVRRVTARRHGPVMRTHARVRDLTHWGRNKMAAILQTMFSKTFPWMKTFEF